MASVEEVSMSKDSLPLLSGNNDEEDMAMELDCGQGAPTSGDISETGVEKLTLTSTEPMYTAKETTAEDGECSSLSETDGTDMEVDAGMMADNESSPMSKNSRQKFQRSVSKFVSEPSRESGTGSDAIPDRGPRQYTNPFLSDEAKKRASRAQRFHDSPYKFTPDVVERGSISVSDTELLDLYKSCGLIIDDWSEVTMNKIAPQYRLDSILIRGINNMSTDEIFSYLYEMGLVPQSMEWVNDACCIAVYKDKQEAAASLLKVTKPISIDHEIVEKKKNLEIEEKDNEKKDESFDDKSESLDYDQVTIIPHNKVRVPMPLGHIWRYAKPCEKAKGILMRYATINDRKQERAERHSEYYKKYGNPNNPGGYRGGEEEENPRRKKSFKRVRYNPSPDPSSSEEELQVQQTGKLNIWSKLSADWHDEEGGRNKGAEGLSKKEPTARANTPIPRFNVPLASAGLFHQNRHWERDGSSSFKRHITSQHQHRSVFDKLDSPYTRKRLWDEEERSVKPLFTADHDSEEDWTSRMKGPTMRMHADAEESRQKLQANRKRSQAKQSISNRLGERVDYEDHAPLPQRRSVKDRLGAKKISSGSHDDELHLAQDYDEDEEYLQTLLQDK